MKPNKDVQNRIQKRKNLVKSKGKEPKTKRRPADITPKFLKMISACVMSGWTDKRISEALGVSPQSWCNMKNKPEIKAAIKEGKAAIPSVIDKLQKTAEGFSYNEVTEVWEPERTETDYIADPNDPLKVVAVERIIPAKLVERKIVKKFIPPSVAAIKYVLNNRDAENWRESAHVDHTTNGKDMPGPVLDMSKLTDDEVAILADLEAKMKS